MNHYTIGDRVHVRASFSNPDTHEALVFSSRHTSRNTVTVTDPTDTTTRPTPYIDALGKLSVDIDTTGIVPGEWCGKWTIDGEFQDAETFRFVVDPDNTP